MSVEKAVKKLFERCGKLIREREVNGLIAQPLHKKSNELSLSIFYVWLDIGQWFAQDIETGETWDLNDYIDENADKRLKEYDELLDALHEELLTYAKLAIIDHLITYFRNSMEENNLMGEVAFIVWQRFYGEPKDEHFRNAAEIALSIMRERTIPKWAMPNARKGERVATALSIIKEAKNEMTAKWAEWGERPKNGGSQKPE